MGLTPNALKVLEGRYLKKDENGRTIETPEEMFRRVARTIADAERIYGEKEEEIRRVEDSFYDFYDMMSNLEFLPNSPTLMNAGRELGQLAAKEKFYTYSL